MFVLVATFLCAGQAAGRRQPDTGFGQLPITFEANRGQVRPQARFLAHGRGYTALLNSTGITLSLRPASAPKRASQDVNAGAGSGSATIELRLMGAANSSLAGEVIQPGHVNYFFGNNPKKWLTNVPTYAKVRGKGIYPGIDLVYYGNQRQLEYDFEVSPGADPNRIRFEIRGARSTSLDAGGNLVLRTGDGDLLFQRPAIYQKTGEGNIPVDGTYVLLDANHVAFRVSRYDATLPLVIDPVLMYSTYLGGSGNDTTRGIAVDASGNSYVAGFTDSVDFPLTTMGSPVAGSPHIFVAKIDPTGSNLLYVDYIGGNNQDYGYALALDSSNHVYVTGSTASSDFPVVHAYQATYPGAFNAFLTKISTDGASLLYSTYLGGNGSDVPSGVALDGSGNVVIAGSTTSTNFPAVNAYQATASPNQGGSYGQYGFLTKFSADGSSLLYSTYFGGSSQVPLNCGGTPCWPQPLSVVSGVTMDSSGNAYAAGTTNTYDFPVTSGSYAATNSTPMNATVGFVSKLNAAGVLQQSTYFYESSGLLTAINAIAVDASGSAYVTGTALSDGTFPVTTTSICDPVAEGFACSFAFVTKFDPTLSTLAYSTFLGANNYATPAAIALDASNNAYVAAVTASGTLSTINAIETYSSSNDILLAEVDATGSSQLWASYLGASQDESPSGIALDGNGNLYLTGSTTSTDFPVMAGAFQPIAAGNTDSFVIKIGPASSAAVSLSPGSLQFGTQRVGTPSASQSILLRNMGSAPLSITSINGGGDFSQSGDCGSGVAAAGSCTLSIIFTPTATGHRTASIVIQDDAAGSPHSIAVSGDGQGPVVSLAPTALTFSSTPVGTSSAAKTVTLTNTGNATLNIAGIQASGDFSQTNTCASTVAASASCTISVIFAPATTGARSGSLTISDDASASPQTVPLSGTSSDFSISAVSNSATVKSGSTATYTLTITPVGGSFPSAVNLTCGSMPSKASCILSPGSVTPAGSPVNSTLTISTRGSSAALAHHSRPGSLLFYAVWIQFPAFVLFGLTLTQSKRLPRKARFLVLFAVLGSLMFLAACAGGTGIAPVQSGTPPGTYSVTVTATSGALQHQLPLTLIVQ